MGTSLGMVSLVGCIEEVERDTWTGLMIDCVIAEILLKLRPDSEREDWRRSAFSAAALIWYGISAYRGELEAVSQHPVLFFIGRRTFRHLPLILILSKREYPFFQKGRKFHFWKFLPSCYGVADKACTLFFLQGDFTLHTAQWFVHLFNIQGLIVIGGGGGGDERILRRRRGWGSKLLFTVCVRYGNFFPGLAVQEGRI